MSRIVAASVVLSVFAALAATANAGIEPLSIGKKRAAAAIAQRAGPAPQEGAPGPVRPDAAGGAGLRPITRGMDTAAYRQQFALAAPSAAGAGRTLKDVAAAKPTAVVIDVIVAYTGKAAGNYADIEQDLVAPAVEEANRSFRLSNVGHISLRLVHAYRTDYVEEGAHFDHVWRFADKGDGYMEEIHGLRDTHRADVAVLIVDDPRGCGLATRVAADADEAFAVVHHGCAAASYSLAHEIGHLIGARHELSYVNGGKWRDIMAYRDDCGGCPRLPVWSSPLVLIDGEPAGTARLDNARIIAEGAARVAAFR
jgi:peptidyl-Asp metalloendopeptidase